MKHDDVVRDALLTKDETRILSWSNDNTLRLWDVATGQQIGPAMKHDFIVNGALLTKDEMRILSWSADKTVRLWDAGWPKGNLLEAACALLPIEDRDARNASKTLRRHDQRPNLRARNSNHSTGMVSDRASATRLRFVHRETNLSNASSAGRSFATLGAGNARVLEDLRHRPAVPLGDRVQFVYYLPRPCGGRPCDHAAARPFASGVSLRRFADAARPAGGRGVQDRAPSRQDADAADMGVEARQHRDTQISLGACEIGLKCVRLVSGLRQLLERCHLLGCHWPGVAHRGHLYGPAHL
jgi:hypothetical protein